LCYSHPVKKKEGGKEYDSGKLHYIYDREITISSLLREEFFPIIQCHTEKTRMERLFGVTRTFSFLCDKLRRGNTSEHKTQLNPSSLDKSLKCHTDEIIF